MAFWGVEVKPGKPVTHYCERARGRLRISQATLGIGETRPESEGRVKIVVQCNVGNRSPVFLCALLTNKTESCHLDVEFEEADDVVFSVLGPRSVYLTGYYVQRIRQLDPRSDTESFGVDIENTQTEGSSYCSDDENYEDSFIDDDDDELKVSPQSPDMNSKGMDEATLENDKSRDGQGHGRQRRKKFQVIESDSDAISEDEIPSKSAVEKTVSDAGEKIPQVTVEMGDRAKDDGVCGIEPKEKVDQLDIYGKSEGQTKLPLDEEKTGVKNEKNELPKAVETLEEIIVSNEKVLSGDTIHENNAKDTIVNQSLPTSNENDQMQSRDLFNPEITAKSKKKRKLRSKKEKTCNVQTDNTDHSVLGDKEHEVDASANMDSGANSEDGKKSKKRKNELQLEGSKVEGIDEKCQNVLKVEKLGQGIVDGDSLTDFPVANKEKQEQQRLEEICTENIGTEYNDMPKEDKSVQVLPHADSIMEDLPAESGDNQEKQIDNILSKINEELLASDSSQPKKKIKKKKKKAQAERDLNVGTTDIADGNKTTPMDCEDHTENAAPVSKRTLSNGLIIEELASGPPKGKVAAPGKVVKINCTGMLKEGGHVFDTETAFKFRLGDEEFIDGWNVGIDGMRVGDKRRLIIPPSMAFGDQGMGENVPPNSWIVYDVELIGVRK